MARDRAVLAGDVGGTHTRLAVYREGALGDPLMQRVYPSGEFPGLAPIVEQFVTAARKALPQADIRRAGFGVAGPADGAVVKFTNLPWVVRTDELAKEFSLDSVVFVNDFAAICRAVPHLGPEHLAAMGGGQIHPNAPKVVLGAGTGLGVGFLVPGDSGYRVVSSEGGHVGFAPRDALQARLTLFLQSQRDGSYVENLLSGRGLDNIYAFLRDQEGVADTPDVRGAMERGDPAAVISTHGISNTDPLCRRAVELFCSIYGAVSGGLALLMMARGGVYIAGGIAAHVRDLLMGAPFRDAFEAHVRYAEFLRSVPRFLITHPQPGLLGAALAAQEIPRR